MATLTFANQQQRLLTSFRQSEMAQRDFAARNDIGMSNPPLAADHLVWSTVRLHIEQCGLE
jgi:hypothetical protein